MTAPAGRGSSKFLTLEFPGDESGTGRDRGEPVTDAAKGAFGEGEKLPEPSEAARGRVGGSSEEIKPPGVEIGEP